MTPHEFPLLAEATTRAVRAAPHSTPNPKVYTTKSYTVYTLLLNHSRPIHAHQRRTTRSPSSTLLSIPSLHLTPSILLTCKTIHNEATPTLYNQNTFCAHPTLLAQLLYLFPSRPIVSLSSIKRIKRWYLNIRLDIESRFNSTEVSLASNGCEELEIEAWQAEYGTSDLKTLDLFESVRGIKRAKVTGSVGAMYCQWLGGCMTSAIGNVVEPFWGEEVGKGYNLWTSGNR
jgi:hypothetical protein